MTYEYRCAECGHEWEAEQSISSAPLKSCPACKRPSARRQVSGGAGFILKGGGWYADGYGAPTSRKTDESAAPHGTESGPAKKEADSGKKEADSTKSETPGRQTEPSKTAAESASAAPQAHSTKKGTSAAA
ncbi:MAG TPA: zinc ribbon domain-containing protein [Polyangiaceae bacterium]